MFDLTLSTRLAEPRALGGVVRTSGGGAEARTGHVKGCPDFTSPATVGLRWMRPNHGEQARRWGAFLLGNSSFNARTKWHGFDETGPSSKERSRCKFCS